MLRFEGACGKGKGRGSILRTDEHKGAIGRCRDDDGTQIDGHSILTRAGAGSVNSAHTKLILTVLDFMELL
jgi:hypothetical protein